MKPSNPSYSVQISFRHLDPSETVAAEIETRARELAEICPRITSVRVTLQPSERDHRSFGKYRVQICIEVPGQSLIVDLDPVLDESRELQALLAEAFRHARRQLLDYSWTHGRKSRRPTMTAA